MDPRLNSLNSCNSFFFHRIHNSDLYRGFSVAHHHILQLIGICLNGINESDHKENLKLVNPDRFIELGDVD